MNAVFVTGTDTGAGKTFVCKLLQRFLVKKGHRAIIQKWLLAGKRDLPKSADICYAFKYPASPHLAAALEKRKISAAKIKKRFKSLQKRYDFVIVEGIGGALVPFNKKDFVIDIAKELKLPVLLVVDNKLGAINHTLLTIETLRKRRMKIIGLIFNNRRKNQNDIILRDNPRIIKALTGKKVLGALPYNKDKNRLYKAFLPIGNKIWMRG